MEEKRSNIKEVGEDPKNLETNQKDFDFFADQNFLVACQSSKGGPQVTFLMNFIKMSMMAFCDVEGKSDVEKPEQYHISKMSNLLLSCLEELDFANKLPQNQGTSRNFSPCPSAHAPVSCNILVIYRIKNSVYCLKTAGFQIFSLDEQKLEMKPLCDSTIVSTSHRNQHQKGFIYSTKTPKIKPQFLIGRTDQKVEGLEIAKFDCFSIPEKKENSIRIIIGTSPTFSYIPLSLIVKSLKSLQRERKHEIEETIGRILEQGKKKRRTLHKQSLYLFSWSPDKR